MIIPLQQLTAMALVETLTARNDDEVNDFMMLMRQPRTTMKVVDVAAAAVSIVSLFGRIIPTRLCPVASQSGPRGLARCRSGSRFLRPFSAERVVVIGPYRARPELPS